VTFTRELAPPREHPDANPGEGQAEYAAMRRRFRLTSPDGPVPEFLLHV
jgi:hypothetical protein